MSPLLWPDRSELTRALRTSTGSLYSRLIPTMRLASRSSGAREKAVKTSLRSRRPEPTSWFLPTPAWTTVWNIRTGSAPTMRGGFRLFEFSRGHRTRAGRLAKRSKRPDGDRRFPVPYRPCVDGQRGQRNRLPHRAMPGAGLQPVHGNRFHRRWRCNIQRQRVGHKQWP